MDFTTIGYEDLELSTQILIKEALKRNIKVEILDRKDNFIRLRKNDSTEYIRQATKTSMDAYITPLIMENKIVTKILLAEHAIKTPDGKTYVDKKKARDDSKLFFNKPIVIKPKSTNFGIGVTILKNSKNTEEYFKAIDEAFSHDSEIIIEEFIEGKEYRFLIIGDEVIAVLLREPANIIGDGKHSISELVDIKNQSPLRGYGYTRPLEKIRKGEIEKMFLEIQGINFNYIPEKDKKIFLRKNSNISTGGDSIDFTDTMPQKYKDIALASAKAVGAVICGADIIIKNLGIPPLDKRTGIFNYAVIELNFNPALHIHAYPFKGKNRSGAGKILDLLGFKEA